MRVDTCLLARTFQNIFQPVQLSLEFAKFGTLGPQLVLRFDLSRLPFVLLSLQ